MEYIIVFGAAPHPDGTPTDSMRRRVAAAARYGLTRPDLHFLLTGGIARRQARLGPSEAEIMADLLVRSGVPTERIALEDRATDTFDSARFCDRFLRARGFEGALHICSSAYHLPRCRILMRIMGWRTVAVPPVAPPPGRFWRRNYWRMREVPAMMWDIVLAFAYRCRVVS